MKNKVGEAKDVLNAMGQRSEKEGIKWTKYFMDKFEKEQWETDQLNVEKLEDRRINKKEYYQLLAKVLHEMIMAFERPSIGYVATVRPTAKGIMAQFKDKLGRVWVKAVKVSGTPKIDYGAMKTIAGMAEDKMYELDSQKVTDSGIILP